MIHLRSCPERLNWGVFGTDMFFVLSGFLIVRITKQRAGPFRPVRFLADRADKTLSPLLVCNGFTGCPRQCSTRVGIQFHCRGTAKSADVVSFVAHRATTLTRRGLVADTHNHFLSLLCDSSLCVGERQITARLDHLGSSACRCSNAHPVVSGAPLPRPNARS